MDRTQENLPAGWGVAALHEDLQSALRGSGVRVRVEDPTGRAEASLASLGAAPVPSPMLRKWPLLPTYL